MCTFCYYHISSVTTKIIYFLLKLSISIIHPNDDYRHTKNKPNARMRFDFDANKIVWNFGLI